MSQNKKTCDICKKSTGTTEQDITDYGDWLTKNELQVHYFCLLLSHHLPQRGKDGGGVLGFLIADIRKEIAEAAKRACCYCSDKNASLRCSKCSVYFHLTCGDPRQCLWEFDGCFHTYCHDCVPWTEEQQKRSRSVAWDKQLCYICQGRIIKYHPTRVIFGPCCGNGYVHTSCMRRYALSAGYYLKCIWCAAGSYREAVRRMGVFVPDRDARWERMKHAYRDLYQRHNICDAIECLCPRGRNYVTAKWELILCGSCGGVGAHNPVCVTGDRRAKEKVKTFRCQTCQSIPESVIKKSTRKLNDSTASAATDLEDDAAPDESRNCFSHSSAETIYPHANTTVMALQQQQQQQPPPREEQNEELSSPANITVIARTSPRHTNVTKKVDLSVNEELRSQSPSQSLRSLASLSLDHLPIEPPSSWSPQPLLFIASPQIVPAAGEKAGGYVIAESIVDLCALSQTSIAIDQVVAATTPADILASGTPASGTPDDIVAPTQPDNPIGNSSVPSNCEINLSSSKQIQMVEEPLPAPFPKTAVHNKAQEEAMETEEKEDDGENRSPTEQWMKFICVHHDAAGEPAGLAVMRIDLNSPRFRGQTLEEIQMNSMHLLDDHDIASISNDLTPIKAITDIVKEIAATECAGKRKSSANV